MQEQESPEENQRKYKWKRAILLEGQGSAINKIRTLYISVL